MKSKDYPIVERWWINLFDSIKPTKKKINMSKELRKLYNKDYAHSPHGIIIRRNYKKSEAGKASQKKYVQKPGVREHIREYYRKRNHILKLMRKNKDTGGTNGKRRRN